MTIGALAYMEDRWMKQAVEPKEKRHFKACRYMDDILMFYAKNEKIWDHKLFLDMFGSCYDDPLKLEHGGDDTFLETTFELCNNGQVRFWLKNQNAGGERKIWRYQDYRSYASVEQKRATLVACLKKVQKMASDSWAVEKSAWDKIREFAELRYPSRMLRSICNYLGASTRERAWFKVRDAI